MSRYNIAVPMELLKPGQEVDTKTVIGKTPCCLFSEDELKGIGFKSYELIPSKKLRGIFLFHLKGEKELKEKVAKEKVVNQQELYLKLVKKNAKKDELLIELVKIDQDVAKHRATLTKTLKRKEDIQELMRYKTETDETYIREYNKLKKLPDLEAVILHDEYIELHTKPIFIKHNDNLYRMGKYRVELYMDGYVNITSTTNSKEFCHPHVNEDGEPCLGNISDILPEMLAKRKYLAAATVMIEYLKSYAQGGNYKPYLDIECFPKATAEEIKKYDKRRN